MCVVITPPFFVGPIVAGSPEIDFPPTANAGSFTDVLSKELVGSL